VNFLLICAIFAQDYRNYLAEAHIRHLLGEAPLRLGSYILANPQASLFPAILLAGIVLEVVKSRFAFLINLGLPVLTLILIAIGFAKAGMGHHGEGLIILYLIVLPLLLVCAIYAFVYRRDLTLRR
jgi:hypothetical protein